MRTNNVPDALCFGNQEKENSCTIPPAMTAPDIFTDWGLGDSGLCDQIQTGLAFKTGLNLILMSMKMFSTARLRNAAPKFKKGYKPELVTPDITIAMTTSDLNL